MIDVHCHLNFHRFEKDFDAVIKRAFEKGITKIINVGTKIDSSEQAVRLAEQYDDLYAIVGIHPHHADKVQDNNHVILGSRQLAETPESDSGSSTRMTENRQEQLKKLGKHPKVVGIGEIGLDYFSYQSNGIVDLKQQKDLFEKQIQIAHELQLPLQIHNRLAGRDILEILDHYKNSLEKVPGMFHCMSGDVSFLKQVLTRGFYVGFDGNITYPGIAPGETTPLSDLVTYAPLDRIVVETDSPYLTPIPYKGQRNEPQYAIITAQFIAQLKNVTLETVVERTTQNVYTVFKKIRNSKNEIRNEQ